MKGNIKRLVATSVATAMLAVSMIAPAVSAAPPNWTMVVDNLAPVVKPGNNAAFQIRITNRGPSNIPALYMDDNRVASPILVETSQGTCSITGGLLCTFGTVGAGANVDIFVVYQTPATGSKFDVIFQANTNGATFSDRKGRSRGDTLDGPASVTLNGSLNFDGGYVLGSSSLANSTSLGGGNAQSTQLDGLATRIYATVEDGAAEDLCGTACNRVQIGEASKVNVAYGGTQDHAFRVTITIRGRSLANPKPDASTIVVVHELDDETTVEIIGDIPSERCASATVAPNLAEGSQGCVIATWIGNGSNANLQIVVWTFYNGKFRGSV